MNKFDQLQNIWLQQPQESVPQMKDVLAAINKYKSRINRVFAIEILLLVATSAAMLFSLWGAMTLTLTTRIGTLLFLSAILYTTYVKTKITRKNNRMMALSTKEFIKHLQSEKLKTCTGSVNEQKIAVLLLCAAYFFWVYGWLSEDVVALWVVYGIFAFVISLMWFVLRPYATKKRQKKIQALITKLEQIKNEEL